MAYDGQDSPPRAPGDVPRPDPEKDEVHHRYPHATDDARSVHTNASAHSTIADHHDVENVNEILRRTYTPKNPIEIVPRSKRRGLFARFTLIAEVTNPYDYSNNLKWFITFIVSVAGAAAPVGSAILLPALTQVEQDLDATPAITNMAVALYMLSMAIFPLWWSAFSETLGRRTIYLVSFALFVVFSVLSAVSHSITMLIVMRMIAGGAAASVQAVGAGTIADIWESRERGRAMGIFYLGPLCGPLLAPIIGGIVAQHWGWRSTQWALAIYAVLTLIFVCFALPETVRTTKNITAAVEMEEAASVDGASQSDLRRVTTRERAQQRSKKILKVLRMFFVDPLSIILYLRFMPVLLTVYYSAVTFGSLYVLNISIQYTFERQPYQFETIIIGLLYIPNSVGYLLASLFGGRWMDSIMKREALKANRVNEHGKLVFHPEDRMQENAWLGSMLYPAALIWYGWTVEKGVFWIAPMVANFFYGVGSMLIFAMATTMLTEFMPRRSASGVALNNLCRNIFACVGGIVGAPVISSIGNGWLFTILGLWAFSSAAVIWAMKRFGPKWREKLERELD
ncbi:hypothetical protein B0A52_01135 [Exophiala mesophila]|uniref:Major facilitator superfamily (MFS) profile domain-containing protein n=1 Tax=Exophiala mesophila TaxID=212818 RepID=A0A438NGJ8_EXOME|nr:hypothetical protein B0A52_01135 [Exophiala mesophila]